LETTLLKFIYIDVTYIPIAHKLSGYGENLSWNVVFSLLYLPYTLPVHCAGELSEAIRRRVCYVKFLES
jgi:hypothetical protein